MTNINKNNNAKDMHSHIEKAHLILDKHLPKRYVRLVLQKLPANGDVTSSIIRNVRIGLNDRIDVLNAMVEVALENKKLEEKFKKLTT